jgi:hypothetical protein
MKHTILRAVFFALCGLSAATASADPAPARTRVARDRFQGTILLGASVGVGSPFGLAGGFLEVRPWRAFGVAVGGGAGGAFGPAVAATAVLAPFGGRAWALGVEGGLSHQFSYAQGLAMPDGRAMPPSTQWASVGGSIEVRPSRGLMLRVGAGRAWLLNTADFGVFRPAEVELAAQHFTPPPGATPFDAARAAHDGSLLGVWYVHVDIAPAWRW